MEKNDLVLVVDDDKSCRDVLRAVLELFKVRVIEAAHGMKGCNLAITNGPRLSSWISLCPRWTDWNRSF